MKLSAIRVLIALMVGLVAGGVLVAMQSPYLATITAVAFLAPPSLRRC